MKQKKRYLIRYFKNALFTGYCAIWPILCILCISHAQVPENSAISLFLIQRGYEPENVGILIKRLDNDSVVLSHNASRGLNPASVSKLITGLAAIELLGINYRFKTRVYIDKPFNRDSGTVDGNLYIKGGADPGFLPERLWLFVRHLMHQGIKEIKKDIILDDSFFDAEVQGPGFDEENSSRAYEAPTGALSASFNTVAVHVAPGGSIGSPVHVVPFPENSGVKIISTAKTTAPGSKSEVKVKTEKLDGKTAIMVFGNMNIDDEPRYVYRKVWDTWQNFGGVLQALFNESGIRFSGAIRRGIVADSLLARPPFYTFESKPLSEFIGHMFKYSSNFAAEMVFKTIAAERDSISGSWNAASKIVEQWWKQAGLPDAITVKNGSGMGNGNRISTSQTVALLERAWNNKAIAPDFVSALPASGVDGTLEKRFEHSPLKQIVRAKTGTLNNYGVSNLAGYVLVRDKTYVFAIFINSSGADQYRHWETQMLILEKAVQETRNK